ncbi:hypothetical protein L7F22_045173 [Adiantum nelumboides]|nr:hypothetical protein [Adiantum nelumboides]
MLSKCELRYYYRIIVSTEALSVFERNRGWHISEQLNIPAMRQACDCLVGHHDFSSFRAAGCQAKSPFKTLDELGVCEMPLGLCYPSEAMRKKCGDENRELKEERACSVEFSNSKSQLNTAGFEDALVELPKKKPQQPHCYVITARARSFLYHQWQQHNHQQPQGQRPAYSQSSSQGQSSFEQQHSKNQRGRELVSSRVKCMRINKLGKKREVDMLLEHMEIYAEDPKRNRGRLQYFQEGGMSQNGHVAAHGVDTPSDDVAAVWNPGNPVGNHELMDGYKEEGSSSQDRQSNLTVHEVGEGSSQAEEGFPHAAFSITGTASPGTLFGGMQSMVPNPMYANIGLHPGFQGTQAVWMSDALGIVPNCQNSILEWFRAQNRMDGYKEEGSSSQDRQSNLAVHEVGEDSSQAEEGFPHAAFSITGTASPGTLFGGMQSMVPNPMYANIGLHPGFQGTQAVWMSDALGIVPNCQNSILEWFRAQNRMDGYKEEGSSSQDRQSNLAVHEVGEDSSQAEEGFPHAAFSITGTASPGTLFGGMQSMVPNPMYANIGLHPGFQGTQGLLKAVGTGELQVSDVPLLLEARMVTKVPPMAPACGLYLADVKYHLDS